MYKKTFTHPELVGIKEKYMYRIWKNNTTALE